MAPMWFVAICVTTWLLGAALFFFLSPVAGILAMLFALLLTEELLIAYRAEKAAGKNRFPQGKQPS